MKRIEETALTGHTQFPFFARTFSQTIILHVAAMTSLMRGRSSSALWLWATRILKCGTLLSRLAQKFVMRHSYADQVASQVPTRLSCLGSLYIKETKGLSHALTRHREEYARYTHK